MLANYPNLSRVTEVLDSYLATRYPNHFGPEPTHPFANLKKFKVIHDNLWGTNRFSWRELLVMDSPILQRLRDIHQTGLAYYVYPSARHSRFEHCLGVTTVASRVFDSLVERQPELFDNFAKTLDGGGPTSALIQRLRSELRLAALLHDAGHSMHSHTSELVYSDIPMLQAAAKELTKLAGHAKNKGKGEVLSFCLSQTRAVRDLLARGQTKLLDGNGTDVVKMDNVSLLIIGRSGHPYTQFLADIISSDFDADKLDYLLRDAASAGLPLRYDLERYLSTVRVEPEYVADDEQHLLRLYESLGVAAKRESAGAHSAFEHYDSFVLRLPRQAMSTIEQIVICKFMLYSYIYHHRKVRAAEGLLARLLRRAVCSWRSAGMGDEALICKFLDLVDPSLHWPEFTAHKDNRVSGYCGRLITRQLPREIFGFVPNMFTHLRAEVIKDFTSRLLDPDQKKRAAAIAEFEESFGRELLKRNRGLGETWEEALLTAGAWLDAPTAPKFENVNLMVGARSGADNPIPLSSVFPIQSWIQAYEAHRYNVRVFAFSEYADDACICAKAAMKHVLKIDDTEFYDSMVKPR
jgi:HD superfamily phosphohydrolase